jgi:hypothetical protein
MDSIHKHAAVTSDQDEDEKAERRAGAERRKFSYSACIPERRAGQDRREEAELKKSLAGLKAQDIE